MFWWWCGIEEGKGDCVAKSRTCIVMVEEQQRREYRKKKKKKGIGEKDSWEKKIIMLYLCPYQKYLWNVREINRIKKNLETKLKYSLNVRDINEALP